MHPGWTDTPGVRTSIPKFAERQGESLRTLEQGVDTVIWLGTRLDTTNLSSGEFWFDREPVPQDLSRFTQNSEADKEELWKFCEKTCKHVYDAEMGSLTQSSGTEGSAAASSSENR